MAGHLNCRKVLVRLFGDSTRSVPIHWLSLVIRVRLVLGILSHLNKKVTLHRVGSAHLSCVSQYNSIVLNGRLQQ